MYKQMQSAMLKPPSEHIKAVMRKKGYMVFNGYQPYDLNIVGIRNSTNVPNSFDDTIAVFYEDEYGYDQIEYFPATTDPGLYWLLNPMRTDGTAIMCEGQYRGAYAIGKHKTYRALEQVEPIEFVRDYNRDSTLDFNSSRKEKTIIGANIHRANKHDTSTKVDMWSAGCQVIARNFSRFMELCDLGRIYWGNRFTYTLLNQRDFDPNAA